MKAYALVGNFDTSVNDTYQKIWAYLMDHKITNYGVGAYKRRPHLTLADYYDLDLDIFIPALENLYHGQNKIDIILTQLGTFLDSGTLFYAPTISKELLTLHQQHHQKLDVFSTPGSYYAPGDWTPHVTIASRLTHKQLMESFDYCTRGPIHGQIVQLSLIEIVIENDIAVDEILIWEKTFC